uniref:Uncharacterized protein n=1 Tax=Meloidogyne incognita TaxID=6306 RepID=A0A914NEX4_MELIC
MLNRSSSSIKSDRNVFATPKSGTPSSLSSQIPSAKLTVGIGKRVRDIVAIFPQGEPVEPSKLCFSEQLNRVDKKVFTMTSLANTEFSSKPLHIDHVGVEEPPGNGFEYVLAIVDRNTGRPIEFKPAALVSFQPRFQPGEELLNGRKRKSVTNYSQDFSMSFDEMRTERNNLTKSFGSAKNVKKLEANIRRSITNETLDAMSTTAFSSPNTSIKKEEFDDSIDSPSTTATLEDDKSKLLSILEKGTSGMLPKPNYDAKVPSDVYKLEQFLPDNFDQFKSGYEQESLKYFKSVDSYQNLINFGVSPLVAKRVGIPSRYANPGIRCTVALKMVVLSKFVQYCFKKRSRALSISVGDVEAFQLPSLMNEYFRKKYLGEGTGKNAIKFQIPVDKKNRALVDLLCLLLLFDEPDFMLPLSPLVQELGVNETMLKNYLTGLGCIVSSATEAQALTMNTANTYS